ncbi:MAG: hypothetical protein HY287_14865 [Planctomycetes bacterium]|nr:hypothetical protein [Planctomycetota bacterium]MBI3835605.1 hypothetical protein [Planctomycetota bacterium]
MKSHGCALSFVLGLIAWGFAASRADATCTQDSQCNDGIACTQNVCFLGNCIFPDGCVDNVYCNGDETCNHATGQCQTAPRNCQPPTPFCSETLNSCVECLNNSQCTTAPRLTCSSQGTCVQCTTNNQCVDTLFCNGTESCNLSTGLCQSGTPVTCSSGKFCSEIFDGCVKCDNDSQCDDGLHCDGLEHCSADHQSCTPGTPVSCKRCVGGQNPQAPCGTDADCRICVGGGSAGDPCTSNANCINGTCPAGGTCTGASSVCKETTGGTQCVECVTDTQCNDNVFCTSDTCIFNVCNHVADPMRYCDDGIFCNGAETCNANNTGCVAGTPVTCAKKCFLGPNPGIACTSDAQCGTGGKCVGLCSETFNACVDCEVDNQCANGKFCDGAETCHADHTCGAGTPLDCTSMHTICQPQFACDEATQQCKASQTAPNGTACDDGNNCTAVDACQNGQCVEQPPLASDPYRCVRLEWRPVPGDPAFPQQVQVGSTFRLALFAVSTGCNEPNPDCPSSAYSSMVGMDVVLGWNSSYLQIQPSAAGNLNPQDPCHNSSDSCSNCQTCTGGSNPGVACEQVCVGGSSAGGQCWDNGQCPGGQCYSGSICTGGTNNLLPCTTNANCPGGGTCTGAATCSGGSNSGHNCSTSADCPGGTCNMNKGKCLSGGTCAPPVGWNWFTSAFVNDCQPGGDAVNSPCTGTVPGNDGNAKYTSISQVACNNRAALAACAAPNGLYVTEFKFKALAVPPSTGQTSVSILPCAGTQTLTQVISGITPPTGYFTDDVLKAIGSPAPVKIVSCTTDASCADTDPCTVDACFNGTCKHTAISCIDPDPCTVDTCVNGLCQHTPIDCGSGKVCYQGLCYTPCSTAAQCDDGIACTADTCDTSPPAPIDGICIHTPNDGACATGLFCQGKKCDVQLGCVFDNVCLGANGNPCPVPGTCDEATDTCGGCLPPAISAAGDRYIKVTPANQGSTPVAILVQGDCSQTGIGCISRYVQDTAGHLGTTPVYKRTDVPAASGGWGIVSVHSVEILPSKTYRVHTECNFAGGAVKSAGRIATTWLWGDVNNNGVANISDVANVVDAFKGNFTVFITLEATNISAASCTLDDAVNIIDVAGAVDAFKGIAFPCGTPCP